MSNQIAETILAQMGGINRLRAMIGVKIFIALENGVQFKFPAGRGINFVKIVLRNDLYDVEFGYARGMDYKVKAEQQGVYADQLKGVFEEATQLYLSL